MKKVALTLSLALVLTAFAACSDGEDDNPAGSGGNSTTPTPTTAAVTTAAVTTDDNATTDIDHPGNDDGVLEGELSDILENLYKAYGEREDVKAAQAEIDKLQPALDELTAQMDEVYEKQIAGEIDDDEAMALTQELFAEMEPIQAQMNQFSALILQPTLEEELTPEGTENNKNIEYFIGAKDIPFTSGFVSEPVFSGAYSVVLLRMEEDADIAAAKTKIKAGVDPNKWICAMVDPSDVIVTNIGDVVILIMANQSKGLYEAFLSLAE
jgi:hypothetical protein